MNSWVSSNVCVICEQLNARTLTKDGYVHKRCLGQPRYRVLAAVPATQFRTVLAPGAPWPYPLRPRT